MNGERGGAAQRARSLAGRDDTRSASAQSEEPRSSDNGTALCGHRGRWIRVSGQV